MLTPRTMLPSAKPPQRELRLDDLRAEVLSTLPYPLACVLARYGLGRYRVTQKVNLQVPDDVYRAQRLPPRLCLVAALQAKLLRHPERVALARFADLFVSRARQVVVFFTDLCGFTEDYNVPGTVHPNNRGLRLPADFEGLYHARVARGLALNIPAALALAPEAHGLAADADGASLVVALHALAAALGNTAAVVPVE